MKQLINHTVDDPAIAVGSSRISFIEDTGNFNITEDIYEKIELSDCNIDVSGLPNIFKSKCFNVSYPDITVCLIKVYLIIFSRKSSI